jgi:hypothetical protein
MNLGPIDEPVRFDWEGAAALSEELRRTASVLEGQVPSRNSIAQAALEEWRGIFAEQFEGNRMKICASDARALASAMREAATTLDRLAEDARAEQARRDAARAWRARHDAWQAEQDSENLLEKAGELVGIGGDSPEPEPFTQGEIHPQLPVIAAPPLGSRSP